MYCAFYVLLDSPRPSCLGVTFGLGLAISGMTHPAKVQNFLDITGRWDPSLACVMGGGLCASALAYQFARRRSAPLLAKRFFLPDKTKLDARLIGGSALFGVGWAAAGMCPGPALANMALPAFGISTMTSVAPFCAAMAIGMRAVDAVDEATHHKCT